MARKKTAKTPTKVTEASDSTTEVQPPTSTTPDQNADVFPDDQPIREPSAVISSSANTRDITDANQPQRAGHAAALGRSGFAGSESGHPEYVGGPRPTMTINLSGYSGGPAMHLQRSLRFNQMQIRFEHDQPDEQYLARLKQAGWSDRTQSEGVWTKQIDREARWQSVAQIEQEFSSLANDIRKDRGLSPVWQNFALA